MSSQLRRRFPTVNLVPMLTKELSTAARIQPSFIEPMQVSPVRELPDGGKWTYEAKLDGYRCLLAKRSSGVVLWSPGAAMDLPIDSRRLSGPAKSCRRIRSLTAK